eukprot:5810272-Amphidinium_carterae.1
MCELLLNEQTKGIDRAKCSMIAARKQRDISFLTFNKPSSRPPFERPKTPSYPLKTLFIPPQNPPLRTSF